MSETVHVGIKAPKEVKEQWVSMAKADRRSLSQWICIQMEAAVAQQQPLFRNPTHTAPAGRPRKGMKAV